MLRFVSLLPIALCVLVPFHSGAGEFADRADKEEPGTAFAKLKHGMTPEQVRQLMGDPKHIARQIFYHRYREQWLYEAAVPIRLTFDCPRGQKPQLLHNAETRP